MNPRKLFGTLILCAVILLLVGIGLKSAGFMVAAAWLAVIANMLVFCGGASFRPEGDKPQRG